MADAMKLGDQHTAIMDAIHGDLLRQNPGAFVEEDGNATLVIPTKPFLTIDVSALAESVLPLAASPPAREEAPAEGAGRPDDYEGPDVGMHDTEIDDRDDDDPELPGTPETRLIYKHFCDVHCLNPDEAADATGALIEDLSALRNRTSEPEAGAVAWRARMRPDGEWMVLDAKYVPSRAADSAVEVQPLFDHSAPATADKLRVAVEALEKIADEAPYRSGYCQSDIEYGPKLSDIEMQTVARQALATLNEQPQ